MLKSLAILAVFFAVAQAPVPASGQASDKSTQSTAKKKTDGDSDKKPLLPSRAVVKPNAAAPAPKPIASEQHGESQQNAVSIVEAPSVPVVWSTHEKIAWGVNLALAGFAAFGVCIAIKTLKTVKQQTNHLVASERAWVLIEPGVIPDDFEPDPSSLQLLDIRPVIRNSGKTPGRIVRVSLRSQQIKRDEKLPPNPEYKSISEVDIMLPTVIPVQIMGTMILLSDFTAIRNGDFVLYVYGFVDYLDFAEEERQSRFCFIYHLGGGFTSMKRGFYTATNVPKTYTGNT
jgi:hypothetical protein